jgi:hypothetical protein
MNLRCPGTLHHGGHRGYGETVQDLTSAFSVSPAVESYRKQRMIL